MDRLTFDGDFCDIAQCLEMRGGKHCPDGYCSQRRVWERLKEYEETGLEPNEIKVALDGATREFMAYDELGPIDHLRELVQAEKDGRLVSLDEKTLLAISAGARAISNNKRLFGATYCWDVFGEKGGPKEISYCEAETILRRVAEPLFADEKSEVSLTEGENEYDVAD